MKSAARDGESALYDGAIGRAAADFITRKGGILTREDLAAAGLETAARAVGSSGRIMAFEPLPRLAHLLQRSMHLNFGPARVTVRPVACGDREGNASLHVGLILGHSSLLPLESALKTVDVQVVALDDEIAPGSAVAVVKIDAEGYELQVWRGMQRIVRDNPDLKVIVEFGPSHLERAQVSIAEWFAEFRANGFSPYEID